MFAILSGLLLAATAAVAQDAGVPADARATINAANAEWIPALKAHDAATIAAPYTDDGIFVTATGAVTKGREAIAQLMRDRFAQMGTVTGGELVQDGLTRQGTFIYEWGHASLELTRDGAGPVHSGGRYLTVWQKTAAGRWAIIRNLSLPE